MPNYDCDIQKSRPDTNRCPSVRSLKMITKVSTNQYVGVVENAVIGAEV
jgi:2-keto-3-deoxy-galactonokinase